jgi:ABC-type Mn2+/Zn2+ transport system ATPase subunit
LVSGRTSVAKCRQCSRAIHCLTCSDLLSSLCALGSYLQGLNDVRHSKIGDEDTRGISGGQRKRVNIGMELVADPCLLFLDEPTSGLDSTSSYKVLEALREVSKLGLNIVLVLHQVCAHTRGEEEHTLEGRRSCSCASTENMCEPQ